MNKWWKNLDIVIGSDGGRGKGGGNRNANSFR